MDHKTHKILFIVIDGFQSLDLFGPLEVFATSKEISSCAYEWEIAAFNDGPVVSESGTKLLPDIKISKDLMADTIVFCGGCGPRTAQLTSEQLEVLTRLCQTSQRVVGICTGAFLIAQLGIVDGKNIVTHWQYTNELAAHNQNITVDEDALYIQDGKIWTSAGVTAGIDLTLALVADDYGQAVSVAVAQQLVVYMRRTGGQTQFSSALKTQSVDGGKISPVLDWVVNNLSLPLTIDDLAAKAGLSSRQFSRVFQKSLGVSPAQYVTNLRMDKARIALSDDKVRIDAVAKLVGYKSTDSFRRAFERKFSTCPTLYQRQFSINNS